MQIILVLIGLITGVGVGVGIGCIIRRHKPSGYIRIDRSEPDEPPMLFLESHIGIHELSKKKYVTYKVKMENYISHE